MPESKNKENKGLLAKWLKRFGFAGFMFFTIKGLIWLVIFFLIWLGYTSWE